MLYKGHVGDLGEITLRIHRDDIHAQFGDVVMKL